jgi:fatty acid synthase subunit beta
MTEAGLLVGRPLEVGDARPAEARIVSVTNASEGKIVKVKGYVYRGSQPVIVVVSASLDHGRFADYENTFEITEEPDYVVNLKIDADVGALQSKGWFGRLRCRYYWLELLWSSAFGRKFPSRTRRCFWTSRCWVSFAFAINSGSNQCRKCRLPEDSQGNPVHTYLYRFGLIVFLPNDGYNIIGERMLFNALLTTEFSSQISSDFNPICVHP